MSQSTYSLRPRNQLDYALLNSGKQLQFPVYDISPFKASLDPDEDGLSRSRDAAPAPLTSDPGEEFMELQKLLTQAKEENKALEKTFQLEAMRQELQALRLRNKQLVRCRHATPSINGGAKLLHEDTKPAQVLQDLRSKKSLSTRADKFLATLEDSSSEEDSDGKLSRDLGLSSVTFSQDSRLILLSNCQASLLHGSSPDARPFRSLLADSTPVFMEFNQDSSLLDEFSRDSRLSRSCGQLDSRLNSVLDDPLV